MAMANWNSFMQSTQLRESLQENVAAASDPSSRILAAFGSSSLLAMTDILKVTGLEAEEAAAAIESLRSSKRVEVIERPDTGLKYLHLTPFGNNQATPA